MCMCGWVVRVCLFVWLLLLISGNNFLHMLFTLWTVPFFPLPFLLSFHFTDQYCVYMRVCVCACTTDDHW